jgi:iron complex transport system ATP-binding protein
VWQVEREGLLPLQTVLEPSALEQRFAATREELAAETGLTTEEVLLRTAVSASQVGLVARLWSVALGSLGLHRIVPELTPARLLVADSHRNPSPMALADPASGRAVGDRDDVEAAAAAITELVVHGGVAAVTEACRVHGRTSPNVLVSNATSSLVASARVLGRKLPDQADYLDAVTRVLLDEPWLSAGGGYRPLESGEASEFQRTGCCLYYRLPGHGLCPDCVLVPTQRGSTVPRPSSAS